MKRVKKRKPISHLFAKLTIVYCIAFSTIASVWALCIADNDGLEITGLLGVILALFGGELLLLCLKTILTKGDHEYEQHHTETDKS